MCGFIFITFPLRLKDGHLRKIILIVTYNYLIKNGASPWKPPVTVWQTGGEEGGREKSGKGGAQEDQDFEGSRVIRWQ